MEEPGSTAPSAESGASSSAENTGHETIPDVARSGEEQMDEQDEDFDDFGDFEEAPCQAGTSAAADAACSAQSPQSPPAAQGSAFFPQPAIVEELSAVAEERNLWTLDSSPASGVAGTIEQAGESVPPPLREEDICDLIRRFELGDDQKVCGDQQLKDFETKSLKLWTLLCYVEETAALKFLWNKSLAYCDFLDALHIRKNALCAQINTALSPKSPSFAALDESARGSANTDSKETDKSSQASPSTAVDSLSVAPVNFDWKNSGLENPFTSSSTTAISACVLECDNFFSADGGTTLPNGPSILEQELERMGLTNGHAASSIHTTSNLPLDLNELIRQNASSEKSKPPRANGHHQPKASYKEVSELSLEARALHDRLPDHASYMLSSRLMFPLGASDSAEQHFQGGGA